MSLAVPDSADLGAYQIKAVIPEWPKSSGGIGSEFEWTTNIEIVEEIKSKPSSKGAGKQSGKKGSNEGDLVGLVWRSDEDPDKDDWTSQTVGEIEMVEASDLAKQRQEYHELAGIEGEIPTIVLNRTFSPLKKYVQARAAELTDEGKDQARDRYAVGIGVALLLLDQDAEKAAKSGTVIDDEILESSKRAAARGVLSVLPEYDRLAREIDD